MSRKSNSSQNLKLTVVLVVVIGGLLGASSLNMTLSLVGVILVLVAVVEAGAILIGIMFLNHRQNDALRTKESD